jgi:hypothetical protein
MARASQPSTASVRDAAAKIEAVMRGAALGGA